MALIAHQIAQAADRVLGGAVAGLALLLTLPLLSGLALHDAGHAHVFQHLHQAGQQFHGLLGGTGAQQFLDHRQKIFQILWRNHLRIGWHLLHLALHGLGVLCHLVHVARHRLTQPVHQLLDFFLGGAALDRVHQGFLRGAQRFGGVGQVAFLQRHGHVPHEAHGAEAFLLASDVGEAVFQRAQSEVIGKIVLVENLRSDRQRVHCLFGPPAARIAADGDILALFDQRARQRMGEDALRQIHDLGFAARHLPGCVVRHQGDAYLRSGIDMCGKITRNGLLDLARIRRRRQRDEEGLRIGRDLRVVVQRYDFRQHADHAVIVRRGIRKSYRAVFLDLRRFGEGDGRRRVVLNQELPGAERTGAKARRNLYVVIKRDSCLVAGFRAFERHRFLRRQYAETRMAIGLGDTQNKSAARRCHDQPRHQFGALRQRARGLARIGRRRHPGIEHGRTQRIGKRRHQRGAQAFDAHWSGNEKRSDKSGQHREAHAVTIAPFHAGRRQLQAQAPRRGEQAQHMRAPQGSGHGVVVSRGDLVGTFG